MAELRREIALCPGFRDVPWHLIFDLLGWKNLQNTEGGSITPQDVGTFRVLAQCYRIAEINEIIGPTTWYVADAGDDKLGLNTADQWSPQPLPTRPNSLFLLLRNIPLPSTDIEIDIELTI